MEIQQQQFTNIITALAGVTEELKKTHHPHTIPKIKLQVLQEANNKMHHLIIAAIMLLWELGTQAIMLWEKLGSPSPPRKQCHNYWGSAETATS